MIVIIFPAWGRFFCMQKALARPTESFRQDSRNANAPMRILFMKEFLKNNKTALILFFLFLSIALISGTYSNNKNTKENINLEQSRVSEPQSLVTEQTQQPIATSSEQAVVKPEIERNISVQTIEPAQSAESKKSAEPPTVKENSTSTATALPTQEIGQPQVLYVGDKKYEIAIKENSSVYDLMLALKQSGQLDFKGKDSAGLGFFVEEINGIKNNPQANTYWIYYINSKAALVGISNYILKPNDIITWKYEKPNF